MDKLKQWEEMGSRAVAGGRSKDAQGLLPVEAVIPNQIWPNEWDQEVAMVAYLIHCHEQRIATLEAESKALREALGPLADTVNAFANFQSDQSETMVMLKAGDARRAAALLEKK